MNRIEAETPLRRPRGPLAAVLLASTALISASAAYGQALPTGGTVASGGVTIATPSATQMTINQSTGSAVVNWNSFSVGAGSTVNIVQPSASSALLNRVTGNTPSTISGQVNANGQVFLVNPNGIAITRSGAVNAAGFVASTLGISDEDFNAGRRNFTGNGASAAVSNAGAITIGRGGYAALIGGSVDNAGTISVPLGRVGLGSGERATLDLSGDGFLQVALPTKATGNGALVSHSGRISADGGRVEIRAAQARDAVRQAVNLSGVVEARSVSGRQGEIVLGGGDGAVSVTGRLDVSTRQRQASPARPQRAIRAAAPATGGRITVTARTIDMRGAALDASGRDGGGQIRIGGDYQGSGPLQPAETTTIDAATTIRADALSRGNGGRVIVWSDLDTRFAGLITARGGAQGGDGGFAEVSGKARLGYTGFTDLSATLGRFGTLLLDPYSITISNGADSNHDGSFTATGDDSVINVTTLQNALAGANVTVNTGYFWAGTGDITVAAPITWSSGSTLTLNAYHSVIINANITISGGGGLSLNSNAYSAQGGVVAWNGGTVTYTGAANTGQSLAINGTAYTLIFDVDQLQQVNSNLGGTYALARNIDATATATWNGNAGLDPIGTFNGFVFGNGFTGLFDGLGHTIKNLTVAPTGGNAAGLFGQVGVGGTVQNIGLVDATIRGPGDYTGGLVGNNLGTVSQSWVSGTVQGTSVTGGLVGENAGTVNRSFSSAIVNAVGTPTITGGLVGWNRASGVISDAYATGAVQGGGVSGTVGGLVGINDATVSRSYAAGFVSGTSLNGGLIGTNSGTANASYFDTSTGLGNAVGQGNATGITGLTTTQLQTGQAGGLGGAFGGGTGLYPYLTSIFAHGIQVVSGFAYADAGATPLGLGGTVGAVLGGSSLGTVSTGANGYYYLAVAAGTLTNGTPLLTYSSANSARVATATGAAVQSAALYGQMLTAPTSALLYSQASADARANATAAAGGVAAAVAAINGTTGLELTATGASFTIDQAVNISGRLGVTTLAGAPLTVAQPITIGDGGALTLNSGGLLNINAAVTVRGANAVTLRYNTSATTNLSFFGGSLTFANADGSAATTTVAGQSLTVNGVNHTLVYNMAQLDAIDGFNAVDGSVMTVHGAGRYGSYAMAGNLNATGVTYNAGLFGRDEASSFMGSFEGLGHTITGLTSAASGINFGALISVTGNGYYGQGGNVRALGLVDVNLQGQYTVGGMVGYNNGGFLTAVSITGRVSGSHGVGGLVGLNAGLITNAYSTATVSGTHTVGGLVGTSRGPIVLSYATGAVSAGDIAGGLVGYNLDYIVQSLATGSVTAGYSYAGGIAGLNTGTLVQTYATGAIRGVVAFGGLIGRNVAGGQVLDSAFDVETTGRAAGISDNANGWSTGMAALTTAQLQTNGLPAGFDPAFWAGGTGGLYPYLKTFFPGGVQAVSGFAYDGTGATPLASTVSVAGGGVVMGSAITGANGYYYVFGAAGTLSNPAGVAAYVTSGQQALSFRPGAPGALTTGLDISAGWRRDTPGAAVTSLAALESAFATTVGATAAAGLTIANRQIEISAAGFALDQAVSQSGTLALASNGTVTQTAALTAGTLRLDGTGSFALGAAANQVGTLAANVGSLSLANGANLATGSAADAMGTSITGVTTSGNTTIAVSGDLTIASGATVSGQNPVLSATGAFINNQGSDAVTATSGRWLIYSSAAASDVFGVTGSLLDSGNTAIFGATLMTLAPGSVSPTGNRYIFANQPTLIITSTSHSKTYGVDVTADLASHYTVTSFDTGLAGVYLGDSSATALTGTASVTSLGAAATAGVSGSPYTITVSQGTLASVSGYALSFVNSGTLTVDQRAITVTATTTSRSYGDANPTFAYTVGGAGLVNGDSLSGALATAATATSNVGTYGITQGTLADANYSITYLGATLTVNQRAVTVTADTLNRAYGDANPALTYTTSSLGAGAALNGSLTTSANGTSNVGAYAVSQGTVTDANNPNYTLTYVGANLTVNQRAVTVTADAASRTYGDANPAFTYGLTSGSLVNGDTLTGTLATTANAASDVGTYGLTQGSVAISANYAVTYVGADLTVNQRAVTVTASAASRAYGDANPVFGFTTTSLGAGVAIAGGLVTSADGTSGVGTYGITQGTVTNANNPNYVVTYVGADLTVNQRAITLSANATSRAYGDANSAFGYAIGGAGLVNGDTVSGALATTATSTSDVGNYGITQGTLGVSANYAVTYVGANLTVNPRAVTVTADAQSRTYGDANPALTYTTTSLGDGAALTGGLVTSATTATGVGAYAIGQGSVTSANNPNYAVTYVGADLTINQRAVTVTADAGSRTYGDANPTLTYGVTSGSLVNGDTFSGALATAAASSDVGTYGITQGTLANANYAIIYQGATLTVNQRAVTVTANATSRQYGDANPVLGFTTTSLGAGVAIAGSLATAADGTSGIGAYGITQGTVTTANNPNYALTYAGADLTVTQRAITVTANAQSRIYGDANPALTYALTSGSLVNGDGFSGNLTTAANGTSNVGAYGITQGTVAVSANYAVTYVGADLTVTPRALGITADAASRIYGDANPAFTYAVTSGSLINGDSLSGALSTGATVAANVGTHAITQGTLGNGNYAISYTGANLTITPRAIGVTADAASRTYGDANPVFAYSVTAGSLVNGDLLSGAMASTAIATSNVGGYAITQGSLAASSNYTMTFTGGSLAVTQRAITVSADNLTRLAGQANPPLTYSVGGRGLANGDSLSGELATTALQGSNPGDFAISQGTLVASANYLMTFQAGNLTVTPAGAPTTGLSSTVASAFRANAAWPGSFDSMKAFALLAGGRSPGLVEDPRFSGGLICLGGASSCFATP
ncbi:MBG domain-containing protein [Phreatobacter stygius]|nr:MBG domain-containing protein [Phreatobacter stygius]